MSTVAVPGARAGARHRNAAGAEPREEPWSRRTAGLSAVLCALGILAMVLGWVRASGTVDLDDQARGLALGIVGLIVAGFGMVAWLLSGLVAVATLRREVLTGLAARLPDAPSAGTDSATDRPTDSATATAEVALGFGTVTGQRRYHRPGCSLLAGKEAHFAALREHAAAGLLPCGVCRPPEGTGGTSRGVGHE